MLKLRERNLDITLEREGLDRGVFLLVFEKRKLQDESAQCRKYVHKYLQCLGQCHRDMFWSLTQPRFSLSNIHLYKTN